MNSTALLRSLEYLPADWVYENRWSADRLSMHAQAPSLGLFASRTSEKRETKVRHWLELPYIQSCLLPGKSGWFWSGGGSSEPRSSPKVHLHHHYSRSWQTLTFWVVAWSEAKWWCLSVCVEHQSDGLRLPPIYLWGARRWRRGSVAWHEQSPYLKLASVRIVTGVEAIMQLTYCTVFADSFIVWSWLCGLGALLASEICVCASYFYCFYLIWRWDLA